MSESLRDLVKRSIYLSMINFDEKDLENFIIELSHLMDLIKKLDEIDLGEIEPLFFIWEDQGSLREDESLERSEEMIRWLEKNSLVENRLVKGPKTVEEK
ncbi:MAG: Asp-tRNA(Asn)/Glu-tRNA(Gln) amidotransferase subunit GatC [Sulfolobales archaeon]